MSIQAVGGGGEWPESWVNGAHLSSLVSIPCSSPEGIKRINIACIEASVISGKLLAFISLPVPV